METLFWHDYETFGADPRRDRACQFGGIRTDLELNIVDDPVQFYSRPAPDFLPDPISCAITGITPQHALQHGLSEAEFCMRIAREMAEPATCSVGYNSLRFDDEVTRHLLYRNFYDPYEREWKQGNSRWDLIDVLRMTQALRPDGIEWPLHEDGSPSFRLESLTKANGIEHTAAHDALADVHATLAMARLVKQKQPKLYDFLFQLRSKHRVLPLLDLVKQEPVLHVSRMFPASRGCLALVLPLCRLPGNPNGVVVVDLLADTADWLTLPADELRRRLFQTSATRPEGQARIPLKAVHINRCPALAPISVLTESVITRYQLDLPLVQERRRQIMADLALVERLQLVFADPEYAAITDPELMLYSGSFFGEHDKRVMQRIREGRPEALAGYSKELRDARLPEMLLRYRARNFPATLSASEQEQWKSYCQQRLRGELPGAGVSLPEFERILVAEAERIGEPLAATLRQYADSVLQQCGLQRV
ncbi:MAG: exodeoxyribonuclease I [Pseudomonadota bacterium]